MDIESVFIANIQPNMPPHEIGLTKEIQIDQRIHIKPIRPTIRQQVSFEIHATGKRGGHRPGISIVRLIFFS